MKIIGKSEFEKNWKFYLSEMKKGKLFVYPTDTIYGIGCDAFNKNVLKIRKLKKRMKEPFSVIVPSKRWILKNCKIKKEHKKYLSLLPGKYTLIAKKREVNFLRNVSDGEFLGVRILDYWIQKYFKSIVFVTTSANLKGERPPKEIGEIDEKILRAVDYVIDDGKLNGKPSTIIFLRKKVKILKRE